MKIENLRSLIKESIQEYISEVEESGNIAAQEAKVHACDDAIATRMKKINMEGLSEEFQSMISEDKMKELKAEVKALENYKKKATKILEKLLEKKENKGKPKAKKEEEVVTDAVTEDVPVDETDVLANMSEEPAEETAINESFIRMQKLAGVITESEYNEKKRLNENKVPSFRLKQVLTPFGMDKKPPHETDLRVGLGYVIPKKNYSNTNDIKQHIGTVTKIEGDKVFLETPKGEQQYKVSDLVYVNDIGS